MRGSSACSTASAGGGRGGAGRRPRAHAAHPTPLLQEKLIVSCEQEILRVHSPGSETIMNQAVPLSCTMCCWTQRCTTCWRARVGGLHVLTISLKLT